jgi:hypothetical protein
MERIWRLNLSSQNKKQAFKEAFLDTMLALIINFPLNILLVAIAFEFNFGIFATSVFLTAVFTTVAIIRKTYTRLYFHKKYLKKVAQKG